MVTVRFLVGREPGGEHHQGARQARRRHGPGASRARCPPLVQPHSIDDVPILTLTLHSARVRLQRAAAAWPSTSRTRSGPCRDVARPSSWAVSPGRSRWTSTRRGWPRAASRRARWPWRCEGANARLRPASSPRRPGRTGWTSGAPLRTAAEVGGVVVSARGGRPVYVRDVAQVRRTTASAPTTCRTRRAREAAAERGHAERGQAPGRERHRRWPGRMLRGVEQARGRLLPARRGRHRDARLRRDGRRQGERADPPPAGGHALGDAADLAVPGLARGAGGAGGGAGHPGADALRLLRAWATRSTASRCSR